VDAKQFFHPVQFTPHLITGLTLAANSTTFGKLSQNREQNMMKQIYGAIFLIFVIAVCSPLRADGTTPQAYPPYVTDQSTPEPSGRAPVDYSPYVTDQSPPPDYAPPTDYIPQQQPVYQLRPFKADPAFTLLDILIYRPIGLAATLAGVGLFVGISPLTALASIPRPHDAFPQAFDILVNTPGAYTFIRPLGDRTLPYQYLQSY
jgi:hypothetical protein